MQRAKCSGVLACVCCVLGVWARIEMLAPVYSLQILLGSLRAGADVFLQCFLRQ